MKWKYEFILKQEWRGLLRCIRKIKFRGFFFCFEILSTLHHSFELQYSEFQTLPILLLLIKMDTSDTSKASGKRISNNRRPLKLSAELADIVGKEVANRREIIGKLNVYVKANNLLDPENSQFFIPDKKMAEIFGPNSVKLLNMRYYISDHATVVIDSESLWIQIIHSSNVFRIVK